MKKNNILAHRGLWTHVHEKNTFGALSKALELGYGIETDIRDSCGELVISHDLPSNNEMLVESLLGQYEMRNTGSMLAFNIKSDGLSDKLSSILSSRNLSFKNHFFFDMSVPDMSSYFDGGMPVYTRLSEYESQRSFSKKQAGFWLDNFSGEYSQIETAKTLLMDGYSVAFVSPELHGRGYKDVWFKLLSDDTFQSNNFYLCTDFPVEAFEFFEVK